MGVNTEKSSQKETKKIMLIWKGMGDHLILNPFFQSAENCVICGSRLSKIAR
jgi:hypothetical protein